MYTNGKNGEPLLRTIKGIYGRVKREAENEAVTFNGISFSSSKQLATKFNQQFNISKLGRHTSSRETRVVTRETIGDVTNITSSPAIDTVSNTLYNRTSWTTQHALSSDHLPIIITINIRHDYKLQQNRRTFTNYKKADWTQFTEDTESAFAQTTIPTNIHTANRIFTNIILMADKHKIPKSKMHSNFRLLPEDIVYKIIQRNNIRRANTCDPALKLLNEEITSDIQKHKQNI